MDYKSENLEILVNSIISNDRVPGWVKNLLNSIEAKEVVIYRLEESDFEKLKERYKVNRNSIALYFLEGDPIKIYTKADLDSEVYALLPTIALGYKLANISFGKNLKKADPNLKGDMKLIYKGYLVGLLLDDSQRNTLIGFYERELKNNIDIERKCQIERLLVGLYLSSRVKEVEEFRKILSRYIKEKIVELEDYNHGIRYTSRRILNIDELLKDARQGF